MVRQQARDIIWGLIMQLGRKGMRTLTRNIKGWLTNHIMHWGNIFHVENYVPCPDGYDSPFMSNRGEQAKEEISVKHVM